LNCGGLIMSIAIVNSYPNNSVRFIKKFISENDYILLKRNESGKIYKIDETNTEYLDYLNRGYSVMVSSYVPKSAISIDNIISSIGLIFNEIVDGPLETPWGFSIDFNSDDNVELRGGILYRIINYYQSGKLILTDEEASDLMIGTIRGSIYEKAKNLPFAFTDYYNNVRELTIEDARNLALIQAKTYASLFAKKQEMKAFVMDTAKVSPDMKLPFNDRVYIWNQYMDVIKALYQAV